MKILFLVGPEVTQAIKLTRNADEVREIFLSPLNSESRDVIIFAVNDSASFTNSGSHWSLCVFARRENKFFHFDSMGGRNKGEFKKLVQILKGALDVRDAEIEQVECLQQSNSYDCGIFVLCHAEHVSLTFMKTRKLTDVKKIKIEDVYKKRSELQRIIKFIKERDE